MTGSSTNYTFTPAADSSVGGSAADASGAGVFSAPLVLSYPYSRTVGATLARFLSGLADARLEGTRGSDGRVYLPPAEFDPVTGAALTEWVECAPVGTVTTWAWEAEPGPDQPLDRPFAWALIRLDGADVEMLHAVDAGSPDAMATGARVTVRWASERVGAITDIACFELTAAEQEDA